MGSSKTNKKIVTIGGGTGSFTVLTGLKKYPLDLTAVVSMVDDGGSTGVLRDELGVLPPGDVRQCLVALANSGLNLRKLMNYRFSTGQLKGHSFGNLFLSALEKTTGSFDKAVETASEILHIQGQVIPATLDKVKLVANLSSGKIVRGENAIREADLSNLKQMILEPHARAHPRALKAIHDADMIVIGPGDLYCSIVPNFLIKGMPRAITQSRAKKVFVCSLMTRAGHTNSYTVQDFVAVIEKYLRGKIDFVIYNTAEPSERMLARYAREGEFFVQPGHVYARKSIIGNLINKKIPAIRKGDPLLRTLIRHDSDKLARLIVKILGAKP